MDVGHAPVDAVGELLVRVRRIVGLLRVERPGVLDCRPAAVGVASFPEPQEVRPAATSATPMVAKLVRATSRSRKLRLMVPSFPC